MSREMFRATLLVTSVIAVGCGAGNSEVSGAGGGGQAAATGGGAGGGAATDGGKGTDGGSGGGSACVDVDKDGFTICQKDCDDNDATIHPGATETANWGILWAKFAVP